MNQFQQLIVCVAKLTKVVRGSEASDLHILLVIGPTLQNRGYSLETEKERWRKERKGRDKRKNSMRGGVGVEGRDGGKEGVGEKRRSYLTNGLKIGRRIKPRRNSFAS